VAFEISADQELEIPGHTDHEARNTWPHR
jgi:hypothetical protein